MAPILVRKYAANWLLRAGCLMSALPITFTWIQKLFVFLFLGHLLHMIGKFYWNHWIMLWLYNNNMIFKTYRIKNCLPTPNPQHPCLARTKPLMWMNYSEPVSYNLFLEPEILHLNFINYWRSQLLVFSITASSASPMLIPFIHLNYLKQIAKM